MGEGVWGILGVAGDGGAGGHMGWEILGDGSIHFLPLLPPQDSQFVADLHNITQEASANGNARWVPRVGAPHGAAWRWDKCRAL